MGQIYLISKGLTREASQRFGMHGTFYNPINTSGDVLLIAIYFILSKYYEKKGQPESAMSLT